MLPKDLRNYFQGVSTGDHGEYVEGRFIKLLKPGRDGFAEVPDPLRLKDKDGKLILCHKCHETASDGRPIVACDECPLSWHMDCVDPPMSNLPSINRKWICPCHIDFITAPRRPKKKLKVVDVDLPRGFVNDGDIDILIPDDPLGLDHTDDFEMSGLKYRLPERGIILDFVDLSNA